MKVRPDGVLAVVPPHILHAVILQLDGGLEPVPLLHDGGFVAQHHDGVQQEHVVSLLSGRSQHLQVARPPQPPEILQPRALGEINGLDTSLNIFQDGKVLFILKLFSYKHLFIHFIHY